jgi:pSer/pThr/pTyr-binding forkhead associated (FHA) protein
VTGRIWLTLPDGAEQQLAERLTIGRDAENDLVLPVTTVSRRHAVLTAHEGRWSIEDCGSANGTYLNGNRLPPGRPLPVRHADRIQIGSETLLFSFPAEAEDPDRTQPHELPPAGAAELSAFQSQIVHCLCDPWLRGASLESLPSNEQIAALLGTPAAAAGVKAALRRVYVKAGIDGMPPGAKRRALCRVARSRGWV